METRTDRTHFKEDATLFLHKSKVPHVSERRVFDGASALIALAHWAPERVQPIKELEGQIKSFPVSLLALEKRVGLKEKRICDPGMSIIDLAMKAVDELIRKKTWDGDPIPLDEIDLIIYFGTSREYFEPATAVLIENRLGLTSGFAFDINNACLGFIEAWCIADAMIACGRVRKALLVSAEKISEGATKAANLVNAGGDVKKLFAAFTLGDGAVAAVVGKMHKNSRGIKLLAGACEEFAAYWNLCIVKSYDEGIMNTDAKELFDIALTKFVPLTNSILDHLGWNKESIDVFIPHQVSMPAIKKGADLFGVPYSKVGTTFPEYGNMSTVSLPFTLSMTLSKQKEWTKQRIITIGFGAGLGIGVFGLETTN